MRHCCRRTGDFSAAWKCCAWSQQKLWSLESLRTSHVTLRPEIFIIIYNTSSLSEQGEHNQHSVRSEPGFILGLGGGGGGWIRWGRGRGYESVKRGAVTQTRNAQTVTLTFKSRAACNMCCVWWSERIGHQKSERCLLSCCNSLAVIKEWGRWNSEQS